MATIKLTRGKLAIVDDEDFSELSRHKWYATCSSIGIWYAARRATVSGKSKIVLMHRQLLNPADSEIVDHKNRDGLDNRRDNLRVCTRTQNQANRAMNRKNATGFKGVNKHKDKYRAKISLGGVDYHLGCFDTPEKAHAAYATAAAELFGEFARVK